MKRTGAISLVLLAALLVSCQAPPGPGPQRRGPITAIPPEEIALAALKSEWETLSTEEEQRRQFFHEVTRVYNAGQWLSEESIDWCVQVFEQGMDEEHVVPVILPTLPGEEELLTYDEVVALGGRQLGARIDIYGGIEPFLNRHEPALDSLEQAARSDSSLATLLPWFESRRRLIADYRAGHVSDEEARQQITSMPAEFVLFWRSIGIVEGPQVIYISMIDLDHVWAATGNEPEENGLTP